MLYARQAKTIFKDRFDAGAKLTKPLRRYKKDNPSILALPRGGVEVAYEIAKKMKIPMNVIVSRKIGSPLHSEYAIGAISEGNVVVIEDNANKVIEKEKNELERRIKLYRKGKNLSFLKGKTIIVVDDGVATGHTAIAALQSVKKLHPKYIVFAAPVCASQNLPELSHYADEVICLVTPTDLSGISEYYKTFNQTTDQKVLKLLSIIERRVSSPNHPECDSFIGTK